MKIKIIFFILAALIIIGAGTVYLINYLKINYENIRPEVLNVKESEVTIAWISERPYRGRVYYQQIDKPVSSSVTEDIGVSGKHEVVIRGLIPSTRYNYWIGDAQNRFQFQTQPSSLTPFSFIMVWGDISRRISGLIKSELPEFIISLTTPLKEEDDQFSEARPYVPIYNLSGINSNYLEAIHSDRQKKISSVWNLDWGGLRMIVINDLKDKEKIKNLFNIPNINIRGVLTSGEAIEQYQSGSKKSVHQKEIKKCHLHAMIMDHNKLNQKERIDFVCIKGSSDETFKIDDVTYLIIPVNKKDAKSGVLRFEIGVETARIVFIDQQKEVMLKQPPLDAKRTCAECRRLADMGSYEESIQAYKNFIKTHKGHFQVDDAYFAIGEILDEKLFRFNEAILWYQSLIKEYPRGTLTQLAHHRIKYLHDYSEYNFEPLIKFETIKKIEFARKKHNPKELQKLLEEVGSLISEYPESKLAPDMQYWMANQYRQILPEKAIETYLVLKEKFPDYPNSKEVLLEIGQIHYENGQYSKALDVYSEALETNPDLKKTIQAQIMRSKRNIRREKLTLYCWLIILILLSGGIFIRPIGIEKRKFNKSIIVFIILVMILLFAAWLIHEQFPSTLKMVGIVFSISAVAVFGAVFSMNLVQKIFIKRTDLVLTFIISTISGLIFFITGTYLAIYYLNIHYLVVFGL